MRAVSAWSWPVSRVLRVIDGDTLDAAVVRDLGFGGSATFPVRLRLNRINAAKVTSVRGAAARARVLTLVGDAAVSIITVRPYKYGGPVDAAGEWMAEVVTAAGLNVSDVLVAEKLAVPWDGQGTRPADT